MYRGADKSLARPGRIQANVSVRMAWIFFGALPCRKKTWRQLASRCCWNRERPWHASELASFLVGLRTYQHPGKFMFWGEESIFFLLQIISGILLLLLLLLFLFVLLYLVLSSDQSRVMLTARLHSLRREDDVDYWEYVWTETTAQSKNELLQVNADYSKNHTKPINAFRAQNADLLLISGINLSKYQLKPYHTVQQNTSSVTHVIYIRELSISNPGHDTDQRRCWLRRYTSISPLPNSTVQLVM